MAKPVGPYTPTVKISGSLILTSGQIGVINGSVVAGGLEPELRQVFENLRTVLSEVGASLSDIQKTTVFLTDIDDYATMNAVYLDEFGDHRPARSAVAVSALPLGATVEIEAVASVSGS